MSTAKSMANNYLNGKRMSSRLALPAKAGATRGSTSALNRSASSPRLIKPSSSMSNLANEHTDPNNNASADRKLQRPASRNALDSIHNGMNAKYAQVQSKVYLNNIKSGATRIPTGARAAHEPARRAAGARTATPAGARTPNERSNLINKIKQLQDELDRMQLEREQVSHELEREKQDKLEQMNQLKAEIQEKMTEHEKQNEEYHQKLLDAYELADQNRRAADSVLSESRQRDEDNRKRIDELESQLAELREFVAVKEEMSGKMAELREQIRVERERYEEQLKSLHQVFENEKIR